MSRRLGRNRKKKLRKELEDMKLALSMSDGLNRHLSQQHSHDVETLGRVRDILGNHSALLDPMVSTMEVDPKCGGLTFQTFNIKNRYDFNPSDAIGDMALHSTVLHLLNLSKNTNWLKDSMHVEFTYKDQRVGYAISDDAMMNLPADYLIQRMSDEMARILVHSIRSNPDR